MKNVNLFKLVVSISLFFLIGYGSLYAKAYNLNGLGDYITQEYSCSQIDELDISNIIIKRKVNEYNCVVHVHNDTSNKIKITAQQNIIPTLNVITAGGKIQIKGKYDTKYVTDRIVIDVYGDNFNRISLSCCKANIDDGVFNKNVKLNFTGSSTVNLGSYCFNKVNVSASGASNFFFNEIESNSAWIHLSGVSKGIVTNLKTDFFDTGLSGSCTIDVKGNIDSANISCSGTSDYNGLEAKINTANIHCSGASDIQVYIEEFASITASGSCDVICKGNGSVDSFCSGTSNISYIK